MPYGHPMSWHPGDLPDAWRHSDNKDPPTPPGPGWGRGDSYNRTDFLKNGLTVQRHEGTCGRSTSLSTTAALAALSSITAAPTPLSSSEAKWDDPPPKYTAATDSDSGPPALDDRSDTSSDCDDSDYSPAPPTLLSDSTSDLTFPESTSWSEDPSESTSGCDVSLTTPNDADPGGTSSPRATHQPDASCSGAEERAALAAFATRLYAARTLPVTFAPAPRGHSTRLTVGYGRAAATLLLNDARLPDPHTIPADALASLLSHADQSHSFLNATGISLLGGNSGISPDWELLDNQSTCDIFFQRETPEAHSACATSHHRPHPVRDLSHKPRGTPPRTRLGVVPAGGHSKHLLHEAHVEETPRNFRLTRRRGLGKRFRRAPPQRPSAFHHK